MAPLGGRASPESSFSLVSSASMLKTMASRSSYSPDSSMVSLESFPTEDDADESEASKSGLEPGFNQLCSFLEARLILGKRAKSIFVCR